MNIKRPVRPPLRGGQNSFMSFGGCDDAIRIKLHPPKSKISTPSERGSFLRAGACKPPLLKGGGPPKAVEGFIIKFKRNPPVMLRMTAPFDKGASRRGEPCSPVSKYVAAGG